VTAGDLLKGPRRTGSVQQRRDPDGAPKAQRDFERPTRRFPGFWRVIFVICV
jgi:hypothetical protein